MIRRIKLHINLDLLEKVVKVKFSNDLQAVTMHTRNVSAPECLQRSPIFIHLESSRMKAGYRLCPQGDLLQFGWEAAAQDILQASTSLQLEIQMPSNARKIFELA